MMGANIQKSHEGPDTEIEPCRPVAVKDFAPGEAMDFSRKPEKGPAKK